MANIKEILSNTNYHHIRELLTIAGKLSQSTGETVYAVGGCVREILVGKSLTDGDLKV